MEPAFSLGYSRTSVVVTRKRVAGVRQRQKGDGGLRASHSAEAPPPTPLKSFYLFPSIYSKTFMNPFLAYVRNNFDSDNYVNCLEYLRTQAAPLPFERGELTVGYTGFYSPFTRDAKSLNIIRRCLRVNQRIRWAMKRLIYRWRISRCKAANTEDIFTCEVPVKRIEIYDWAQRSKYAFEAATVYRDYLSKIHNTDYGFVKPMMPRNPFTNAELTYGQLHFTIRALIGHGFNHWSFDALKRSGYSCETFTQIYGMPLRNDSLIRIYRTPTDADCKARVLECIESEFGYHGVTIPHKYGWHLALDNHPDCETIRKWRALSLKRDQIAIRYDGDMFDLKMLDIHAESLRLMSKPLGDIRKIYMSWAVKLPAKESESESESEPESESDSESEVVLNETTNTFTYTFNTPTPGTVFIPPIQRNYSWNAFTFSFRERINLSGLQDIPNEWITMAGNYENDLDTESDGADSP